MTGIMAIHSIARRVTFLAVLLLAADLGASQAAAEEPGPLAVDPVVVGDPQLMSDHPWFPGELSCSTFERLFATQSALYQRVTGRTTDTDEGKAIASWYWRNLNFYHNYSPQEYLYKDQLSSDDPEPKDGRGIVREYWSGLFAYGFALCGTTHAQYTAEMETLLGHSRARAVDVAGHTSFEVFLKDFAYGTEGDWAMLDHDISAIVFDDAESPTRLLNIHDIAYSDEAGSTSSGATTRPVEERESILDNVGAPHANHGWFKAGLYFPNENSDATDSDSIGTLTEVTSLAPLSGYSGAPPMLSLRRNEVLRRYLKPGLGKDSYVYWGANMNKNGLPGPSRDRTWACEPERMFGATTDTSAVTIARFGNAVYVYRPNFADGSYRDGVIEEDEKSVTFRFQSPYTIAATPAKENAEERMGTLMEGCTNGLVLIGQEANCTAQLSTDNGTTWSVPVELSGKARQDLTDLAKGHHAYYLRLNASASDLAGQGIAFRTVCIANDCLIPHLKSDGTTITYNASRSAIFSAGPNLDQAAPFVTDGGFGKDQVTLTVPAPDGARIKAIHAASRIFTRNPPDQSVLYQIEYSADGGDSWAPILHDWKVEQLGYQVEDYHSHAFCAGAIQLDSEAGELPTEVQVRFVNDGRVPYERAEVHLVYETPNPSPVKVRFNWTEGEGDDAKERTASHVFPVESGDEGATWEIPTGASVETNWVEMTPVVE